MPHSAPPLVFDDAGGGCVTSNSVHLECDTMYMQCLPAKCPVAIVFTGTHTQQSARVQFFQCVIICRDEAQCGAAIVNIYI
jgi:hypothetical protein